MSKARKSEGAGVTEPLGPVSDVRWLADIRDYEDEPEVKSSSREERLRPGRMDRMRAISGMVRLWICSEW